MPHPPHAVDLAPDRRSPSPLSCSVAVLAVLTVLLPTVAYGWTQVWLSEGGVTNMQLGTTASSAGDINGDGYSDLLVGAHNYDLPGTGNVGFVAVYLGSAGGLATAYDFGTSGATVGEELGRGLSAAGDVNGDGYDDILIGRPGWDNGQANEGRVELYYGGPAFGGNPDWTFEPDVVGARAGHSIAYAGDLNGDGYSDFVFGMPHKPGQFTTLSGAARVYLGSASGPVFDAEVSIPQTSAFFGSMVASAGDVNADGYDDILISAPNWDGAAGADAGYVGLWIGSSGGLVTTVAWSREGDAAGEFFGTDMDTAGDFDGDGYADVAIGSPHASTVNPSEGALHLFAGSAGLLPSTPTRTIHTFQVGAQLGLSVAYLGDVDGDGFGDVAVGAPFTSSGNGAAYAVLGKPAFGFTLKAINGAAFSGENLGFCVSGAGDVDGDGFTDLFVGAARYTNGQSFEGAARVYSLNSKTIGFSGSLAGESAGINLGSVMDSAGDVNGDGYDDLIYGMPNWGSGTGAARILSGGPAGVDGTVLWFDTGLGTGYGAEVAGIGDVNGDGYADVAVAPAVGQTEIYFGGAIVSNTPDVLIPEAAPTGVGRSIDGAGDVNGDGYADLIIGYPFATGTVAEAGVVRVHLGGPAGPDPTPYVEWVGALNPGETHLGQTVIGAGDIDGNGYDDVAFGCDEVLTPRVWFPLSTGTGFTSNSWGLIGDPGFAQELAALGDVNGDGYADFGDARVLSPDVAVFWGGPSGPTLRIDAYVAAATTVSISGAGDMNGDGFSDVAVGESGGEDAALVLWGGASGIASASARSPGLPGFGTVLTGLGDVNGDGFADVAIAAPLNDTFGVVGSGVIRTYVGVDTGTPHLHPLVRNVDGTPLALGSPTNDPTAFRLEALQHSARGRSRVAIEYQVAEVGHSWGPRQRTGWMDYDPFAPLNMSATVAGLTEDTRYRWRMRIVDRDPRHVGTHWISNSPSVGTLWQLRTRPGATDVPPAGLDRPHALALAPPFPNPTSAGTIARFSLTREGPVDLAVYDVTGRRVRTLLTGRRPAGTQEITWDGRNDSGRPTVGGVYFIRLQAEGVAASRKIVRAR